MQNTHWKITQPCHEPIEKMDKTANGHYCHSCEKEVIDLDGVHPNDIGYRPGDKLCGRIGIQQPVVRGLSLNKWSSFLLKWMGASALFFIPLKKGKAQTAGEQRSSDEVKEKKTLSRKKIVVGTVRDERNKPVRTQVTLQDSTGKIIAQTDSIANGRYLLNIDTAKIEGDTLSLTANDSIQWTADSSFVWSYPKDTIYVCTIEGNFTLGWTADIRVETFVFGGMVATLPAGEEPDEKQKEIKTILNHEMPAKKNTKQDQHKRQPQKQEEQPEKPVGVVPPATNSISRSKNNSNKK